MKNRALGIAIAAAAMAGLTPSVNAPSAQQQIKIAAQAGAPQLPGMTLAQMLLAMTGQHQSYGQSWYRPTYPRRGWTVAEGKRRARRRRNRLRAKGQHRKAVR